MVWYWFLLCTYLLWKISFESVMILVEIDVKRCRYLYNLVRLASYHFLGHDAGQEQAVASIHRAHIAASSTRAAVPSQLLPRLI